MMGDHYTFGQMAKSSIYLVGFTPHVIHEKILSAVSIEGSEDVKKQLQSGYDDLQYMKCQLPCLQTSCHSIEFSFVTDRRKEKSCSPLSVTCSCWTSTQII